MSNSTDLVKSINDLNNQITFYFTVVSSAIGLPTNLISAFIFARLMMKNKNNMGLLCMLQSIVDFVLLLLLLFVLRPNPLVFAENLFIKNNAACKLLTFIRRFISHISCNLTIILTFDRFVAVCFQIKYRFMQNRKILLTIISVSTLVVFIGNFPNLLFYVSYSGSSVSCTTSSSALVAASVTAVFFRAYFPLFTMGVMNFLIIRKMRKSSRVSLRQTAESRKENSFTMAVISYDVFFFITSLPVSIFLVINDVYDYSGWLNTNPILRANFSLYFGITLSFSYGKQFLTFFMNLFFNKIYRKEMRNFLFSKNTLTFIGTSSNIRPTV